MDVGTCFVNTYFVIAFFIFLNIMVVNVGNNKHIVVSEGLNVSLCKSCSPRNIRKYTLFRETDLPDTDPGTSDEQDEVAQEQYTSWPAVFIIPRESVRTQILCRLDKKIPLTESERTPLLASVFDICIKCT